ncbi:MAG: single-stranded DNA-binding protein [Steroidobacteraceae bacterium]
MIDALIAGRVHKTPQSRVSANGKRFCTAVVRAAARDGDALFVSVIVFSQSACDALLALDDGDSVALAGELQPKIYHPRDGGEPRPSLDLVAHKVLTEYHITRKRNAVNGERDEPAPSRSTADAPAPADADPEFNDSIPF